MGAKRHRGSRLAERYPENTITITTYEELKNYSSDFARGDIELLVILSGPGKGKSQIIRKAMEDYAESAANFFAPATIRTVDAIGGKKQKREASKKPLYIKGICSPIRFHILGYLHQNEPICVDDADSFFNNPVMREKIKHLTESDQHKKIEHNTSASQLNGVAPDYYYTNSSVCIIKNSWDTGSPDVEAIESRGLFLEFNPDWHEVYKYMGTYFYDQEIFDYLRVNIPYLKSPDVRICERAYALKKINKPWKVIIDTHFADRNILLVRQFMNRTDLTKEQQITEWIKAVKIKDPNGNASRRTWYRYIKQLSVGTLPDRIILTRTTKPAAVRPPDGKITPKKKKKGDVDDVDEEDEDSEEFDD